MCLCVRIPFPLPCVCVFVSQKKKRKKSINNYHNYEISCLDKKIKEEKKSWSI